MSKKKKKGKVSQREYLRRKGHSWKGRGGHCGSDGVKFTPVKGGYQVDWD